MIKERRPVLKNAFLFFLAFALVIGSCATTNRVNYPDYQLDDEEYQKISLNKSVYIAPIDQLSNRIGSFREVYRTIQSEIESYMRSNGFNVLPSKEFENSFTKNLQIVGGFFHQQNGQIDTQLLNKCIKNTITELKQKYEFSAIVLPYLVFSPLKLKRPYMQGTWDGVERQIKTNTVSGMSFSPIQTMSLKLVVLSNDGNWIFKSQGGIDFIQKVKEVGTTTERRVALAWKESKDFSIRDIREGIEIAFHPFIFCPRINNAKKKL